MLEIVRHGSGVVGSRGLFDVMNFILQYAKTRDENKTLKSTEAFMVMVLNQSDAL